MSKRVYWLWLAAKQDLNVATIRTLTESFGLVLVEAESYGIPIVVMDSARGALEIVKNNENGIIVKDRNKEEMANKICLLIEDLNERNKLGKCGREDSKKYNKSLISENWFSFIEKITRGEN